MSSLKEILKQLAAFDNDENEAIDPAEVIGELQGKVDGIKAKLDEWDAEIGRLDKWVKEITSRKTSIANAQKRLKDYVQYEMHRHEYEKLPGEIWEIKWRKNPAKVEIGLDACAETFLKYRSYMRQETSYNWDKNAVKDKLKAGEKLDFARLTQDKNITFGVKKK